MTATSKRLAFLQQATKASSDPFAWYGLALEYRSLERFDEALQTFEQLRTHAPDYLPMYLMCGQMLEKLGRMDDARAWLQHGVELAKEKREGHALSELEAALAALN